MGHGQWISQVFAGSCGMVRFESMDSESCTGRIQYPGIHTLSILITFQAIFVLISSFSTQSFLHHFHFHSQFVSASRAFNFNPCLFDKEILMFTLQTSCSSPLLVPGLLPLVFPLTQAIRFNPYQWLSHKIFEFFSLFYHYSFSGQP